MLGESDSGVLASVESQFREPIDNSRRLRIQLPQTPSPWNLGPASHGWKEYAPLNFRLMKCLMRSTLSESPAGLWYRAGIYQRSHEFERRPVILLYSYAVPFSTRELRVCDQPPGSVEHCA